jgi:hypothetical protein
MNIKNVIPPRLNVVSPALTNKEVRSEPFSLAGMEKVSGGNGKCAASSDGWIVVGGCNDSIVIKNSELSKYSEGYGWAALIGVMCLLLYVLLTGLYV